MRLKQLLTQIETRQKRTKMVAMLAKKRYWILSCSADLTFILAAKWMRISPSCINVDRLDVDSLKTHSNAVSFGSTT